MINIADISSKLDFCQKIKVRLTVRRKEIWTRIGDRLPVHWQTDSHEKEEEKDSVTVEIFSLHNNHTQQLPYSVCVRCHAVTHCGS